MCVEITGVGPGRRHLAIAACCKEWGFVAGDFDDAFPSDRDARKLTACAEGALCGGETEEGFADRIAQAVWEANGGYCQVTVRATYLEPPPCEEHVRDERHFEAWENSDMCPRGSQHRKDR